MKQHTSHNIICLEAEWEYSEQNPKNRFSLNTLPMLNWLKEAYDCEVIYRRFRTKFDLKYYLDYFRAHAKGDDEEEDFNKYDIILKSASNLNDNLNCSKELEHYAS